MTQLLLQRIDPDADIDFLNETLIGYEFVEKHPFRDYTTGYRVLAPNDAIIFKPASTEEELFLKLKFRGRIAPIVQQSTPDTGQPAVIVQL